MGACLVPPPHWLRTSWLRTLTFRTSFLRNRNMSQEILDRIADGHTDLVFEYVAAGHAASSTDKNGVSLLQWCSYYGDVSSIKFLLAHGESLQSLGEKRVQPGGGKDSLQVAEQTKPTPEFQLARLQGSARTLRCTETAGLAHATNREAGSNPSTSVTRPGGSRARLRGVRMRV